MRYSLDSTGGEIFAVWVSYYCLLMCLVIMPILSIYVLTRDMKDFEKDPEFETEYGMFWDGLRKHNKP